VLYVSFFVRESPFNLSLPHPGIEDARIKKNEFVPTDVASSADFFGGVGFMTGDVSGFGFGIGDDGGTGTI